VRAAGRTALSAVAAIVLAGPVALVAGCDSGGGGHGAGWWRVVAPDNDDSHLVVLGDRSAWLLGNGEGRATSGDRYTGRVWDGDRWRDADDPVLGTLDQAVAVSRSLAYGTTCTVPATGQRNDCHLMRWTGGQRWHAIDVPPPPGATLHLDALTAAGPDDVWLTGATRPADWLASGDLTTHPYAAHWNGHYLIPTPVPQELTHLVSAVPMRRSQSAPATSPPATRSAPATSPPAARSGSTASGEPAPVVGGEVWGWGADRSSVARWDGRAWRSVALPGTPDGDRIALGADAGGTVYAATADPAHRLVRWQGGRWQPVSVPAGVTVPAGAALGPAGSGGSGGSDGSGGLWVAAYRGERKECALYRDGRWGFRELPPGPKYSGTPAPGDDGAAPVEVDGFVTVPGGGVWAYGISAVIREAPPSDDSTRHRIIWRYGP
jgi:hypothetical protein